MSSSTIKNFFEKLRTCNATSDKNRELTLQTNLLNILDGLSQKNHSLASLKEFFSNAQFKLVDQEIFINEIPIQKIETLLRAGKLKELFNLLHIFSEVTSRDEYNFQSLLLPEIPDVNILRFAEKYKQAQLQHPDLDILVTSYKDIERKLTQLARDKLNIFLKRIKCMPSKNEIVHGLFSNVKVDKVDKNLLENIVVATNSREGCYLVKTEKSKTKTFKLMNRLGSEISDSTSNASDEFTSIADLLPLNLQIYLRILLKEKFLPKQQTEKKNLIKNCNLEPDAVKEENIPYLITKYESILWKYFCENNYGNKLFNKLSNDEKKILYNDVCKLNDEDACISCSPLAPRNSFEYVDISKLPVNMTVTNVKKSTLLELLVDIDINLCSCACTVL